MELIFSRTSVKIAEVWESESLHVGEHVAVPGEGPEADAPSPLHPGYHFV